MNPDAPEEVWLTITGEINQTMIQKVFQLFSQLINDRVKTVHLLLHSGGGFVSDGICLYNYLSNVPINIIAYNAGNVSSMAVIVFLAAKRRIAADNATFMIHKTHASPNPGVTAAMLKEIADSLDIDNARTEAILLHHLTLPKDKWVLHEHGNLTITAQEGMNFALVHEIGHFSPLPNGALLNI